MVKEDDLDAYDELLKNFGWVEMSKRSVKEIESEIEIATTNKDQFKRVFARTRIQNVIINILY